MLYPQAISASVVDVLVLEPTVRLVEAIAGRYIHKQSQPLW